MKIAYIHTLDGKPAFFDGDQICFANSWNRIKPIPIVSTMKQIRRFANSWNRIKPILIVSTMKQIRRERSKTIRWRKARGYNDDGTVYGFQKIIIP